MIGVWFSDVATASRFSKKGVDDAGSNIVSRPSRTMLERLIVWERRFVDAAAHDVIEGRPPSWYGLVAFVS